MCETRTTAPADREISINNLGEEQCAPGHQFGPAVRSGYLIHYVVSGRGEYFAHNRRYKVSAGQGFLIRPGEITTYRADERDPWRYLWIGYQGSGAGPLTTAAGLVGDNLVFDLPQVEEACALIRGAAEDMKSLRLGEISAMGKLLCLMARIGEHNASHLPQDGESAAMAYYRKAAWYIEGRLTQGVSVTDVASFVGLCRSQLFRVFREAAHLSPQEWIQQARLRHAAGLLISRPTLSLSEVAASAGYSGAAQMTAAFRRYYRATPGEYRKSGGKIPLVQRD